MPLSARHPRAAADQEVAVRRHRRLHDAVARPLVLPEHRAVGRRHADGARTVHAARPARRHRSSPGAASCSQSRSSGRTSAACRWPRRRRRATRQWRRPPHRRPPAASSRCPSRGPSCRCPTPRCATRRRRRPGVERVQDARAAKCVNATVAEGRRRTRPGAGIGFPEPCLVAVSPHGLAGLQVVGGHDLVLPALLLREEAIAANREGRPARSDRPAPHLHGRRLRPVGLDPHTANDAVTFGSAKAGPDTGFAVWLWPATRRRCRWPRTHASPVRWRLEVRQRFSGAFAAAGAGSRGLVAALGKEPFLGRRRPSPLEVRIGVAGEAVGSDERHRRAGKQDRADQCHAPAPARHPAADHGPHDQGEAQDREGIDRQHEAHHPVGNGRVNEARDGGDSTTITTRAPSRSDHRARLKNSHQRMTTSPKTRPDSDPPCRPDLEPRRGPPARRATQRERRDAGPQPEWLPRSRFVCLCHCHSPSRCAPQVDCSRNLPPSPAACPLSGRAGRRALNS